MNGDDRAYQAFAARKATKRSRPKLDCGHTGDAFQHIWCDRLACKACADLDHDCSAFGGAKSSTEKGPEPVETVSDLDAWAVAMQDWIGPGAVARAIESGTARFRCRGCRLWIAQDVKLCGPCSALPPCSAERLRAEWGLVLCFRPAGHDGQHESVQGRCWMNEPNQVEPLRRDGLCGERLDSLYGDVRLCREEPSHALPHRDGTATWWPIDDSPAPARRPWWKRWLP